ncbi:tol-pal system YbgF family protein [Lewinella sp. 4G2]|uniref:tetratricopeptide repeat protein n=1 Tax=Lewinella sp. 4G2 TaxID=1803372 RepID=UPI0007B49956|nr:hypothetical protein [Lewinella sp. 4G2]OAV43434.1 hypothetical protein A3850_002505 [Lewinella sp. 4G2]
MTQPEFSDIEDYLDGVDGKSFADLAKGMDATEEATLRERIEQQRNLRLAVGATGLRQQLEVIHEQRGGHGKVEDPPVATEQPARSGGGLQIALLLVGILLLSLAAYFFFRPTDAGVYAAYEYQDPGLPVVMDVTADPAFSEAMTLFKRGEYAQAQSVFSALTLTANDTLIYYRGASAYYAGDLEIASGELQRVTDDTASLFQNRAGYLLALTLLKTGRTEEGMEQLQSIVSQPDHQFRGQAEQLMRELVN